MNVVPKPRKKISLSASDSDSEKFYLYNSDSDSEKFYLYNSDSDGVGIGFRTPKLITSVQ